MMVIAAFWCKLGTTFRLWELEQVMLATRLYQLVPRLVSKVIAQSDCCELFLLHFCSIFVGTDCPRGQYMLEDICYPVAAGQ